MEELESVGHETAPANVLEAVYNPPYRILIIGHFSGDDRRSTTSRIDGNNFRRVLASFNLSLSLSVNNHLAPEKIRLKVDLPIGSLEDFHPDHLCRQLPPLRQALALLQQAQAFRRGELSLDALREEIDRYAHTLDLSEIQAILDLPLGSPGHLRAAPRSPVSDSSNLAPLLAKGFDNLHKRLNAQLGAILHHPRFKSLEARWRSLFALLKTLPRRHGVDFELYICNTPEPTVLAQYRRLLEKFQGSAPFSLTFVDITVNTSDHNLHQLENIAKLAEHYQLPTLTTLSADFFKDIGLQGLASRHSLDSLLERPRYEKWRNLRRRSHARWLTCAFNNYQVRPLYRDPKTSRSGFTEADTPSTIPWGNAAWLLLRLVLQGLGHNIWPTEFFKYAGVRCEDLAMHEDSFEAAGKRRIPLTLQLNPELSEALARHGILPLQCQSNRDHAFVTLAPMVAQPRHYNDILSTLREHERITLPYALLWARINVWLRQYLSLIDSRQHPAHVQDQIENLCEAMIADSGSGHGVNVRLRVDHHSPQRLQVDIRLHFGQRVLRGVDTELNLVL